MVVFTCNNCGESLKKNHVDKHNNSKCRKPIRYDSFIVFQNRHLIKLNKLFVALVVWIVLKVNFHF